MRVIAPVGQWPAAVPAHGIGGGRSDLPIPFTLAVTAAAVVLVVMSVFAPQAIFRTRNAALTREVLSNPSAPIRPWRSTTITFDAVLVGAMLPMAMALEKTGAAAAIAGRLAALSGIVGPLGTLGLLFLFAALVTQIVSNSAAAALVTPLAISLANAQGLPPQPFAIAMAVAVTTSYLTPLTNTDNLLVREAGTYTMRHYVINGLPLFVIQLAFVLVLSWFSGVR